MKHILSKGLGGCGCAVKLRPDGLAVCEPRALWVGVHVRKANLMFPRIGYPVVRSQGLGQDFKRRGKETPETRQVSDQ